MAISSFVSQWIYKREKCHSCMDFTIFFVFSTVCLRVFCGLWNCVLISCNKYITTHTQIIQRWTRNTLASDVFGHLVKQIWIRLWMGMHSNNWFWNQFTMISNGHMPWFYPHVIVIHKFQQEPPFGTDLEEFVHFIVRRKKNWILSKFQFIPL